MAVWSLVAASAIALVCSSGCSLYSSSGGSPDAGGACPAVAGEAFQSVIQYDCGVGANGQQFNCYWLISFDGSNGASGGGFHWDLSDYGLGGSYTCMGNWIQANTVSGASLAGFLDPTNGLLDWDRAEYAPCPTSSADQDHQCPK